MSFPQAMIAPADPICITWHHQHIQRICWVLGKKRTIPAPLDYEIIHCKTATSLLAASLEISQATLEVFSVTSCKKIPAASACCVLPPPRCEKKLYKKSGATQKCCLSAVLCLFTTCFFDMELKSATVSVNSKPWLCHTCFKGFSDMICHIFKLIYTVTIM